MFSPHFNPSSFRDKCNYGIPSLYTENADPDTKLNEFLYSPSSTRLHKLFVALPLLSTPSSSPLLSGYELYHSTPFSSK